MGDDGSSAGEHYSEDSYGSESSPSGAMILAGQAGAATPGGSVGGSAGSVDSPSSSDGSDESDGQAGWWDREAAVKEVLESYPAWYAASGGDWTFDPPAPVKADSPTFEALSPPPREADPPHDRRTILFGDSVVDRYHAALHAADHRLEDALDAARDVYRKALNAADATRAGAIAKAVNAHLRERAGREYDQAVKLQGIDKAFFAAAAAADEKMLGAVPDLERRRHEAVIAAGESAADRGAFRHAVAEWERTEQAEWRKVTGAHDDELIDAVVTHEVDVADADRKFLIGGRAAAKAFDAATDQADADWLKEEETARGDLDRAAAVAGADWAEAIEKAENDYRAALAAAAALPPVAVPMRLSVLDMQSFASLGTGQTIGNVFVLTLQDGSRAVFQIVSLREESGNDPPAVSQGPQAAIFYGRYPANYTPQSAAEFPEMDQGAVNPYLEPFPNWSEATNNRIGAVGQLGLAAAEAAGAVATAPTGVGPVVLGAAAADDATTALMIMWTGQPQRTLRNAAVFTAATAAGVPDGYAEGAGFAADFGPGGLIAIRHGLQRLSQRMNGTPLDCRGGMVLTGADDGYGLAMAGRRDKDPGIFFDIVAHGARIDGIMSQDYILHGEKLINADELVDILVMDERYINGQPVRLLACQAAGGGDASFAKKLADALDKRFGNGVVRAPDGDVQPYSNRTFKIIRLDPDGVERTGRYYDFSGPNSAGAQ